MAEARSDEFAGMADELRELADRLAEQARLAASLTASLASRSVIDQAIGIIMSQNRCDAEEAFDVLRRASNNRNVKLRDLATEIVIALCGQPPHVRPGQGRADEYRRIHAGTIAHGAVVDSRLGDLASRG